MSKQDKRSAWPLLALWLTLALYAAGRYLEISHNPPSHIIVALDVLSALVFALVHGSQRYGWRAILIFTAICIVVGNIVENIGVLTGLPFGHYYFAELMGPKLWNVPILLGVAYIGMAYVSWTVASLIVGDREFPSKAARVVTVPLTASFVMVAWDLAQDPVWSTVLHGWVWRDGGPWFGVPILNYAGWYLNVFIIYLLFALYLRRDGLGRVVRCGNGGMAVTFYILCAAGNVAQTIPTPNPAIVLDPSGAQWRVADITGASALVSIFAMGAFAVVAWIRMTGAQGPARD